MPHIGVPFCSHLGEQRSPSPCLGGEAGASGQQPLSCSLEAEAVGDWWVVQTAIGETVDSPTLTVRLTSYGTRSHQTVFNYWRRLTNLKRRAMVVYKGRFTSMSYLCKQRFGRTICLRTQAFDDLDESLFRASASVRHLRTATPIIQTPKRLATRPRTHRPVRVSKP